MKQNGRLKGWAAALLAVMLLFSTALTGMADENSNPLWDISVSDNPLLDPVPVTGYTGTDDEFLNILLLGLDLSYEGEAINTSSSKKDLMVCHTDAVILAAINLTDYSISLISIPRDTLVYVPGVRGIYKLNNAYNCADNPANGCMHTCEAVGKLLGGIQVDKYLAVDIEAMIKLCDAIGGVDFDMEMTYSAENDRHYEAGYQHLDGVGILDYVRARKNSSGGNYTDIARTRRQRKMMEAIYQKLRGDLTLINKLMNVVSSGEVNAFTNLDMNDLFYLMQVFMSLDNAVTNSYGLEGDIKLAFGDHGWNFCFTDTANYSNVMKNVFGLDIQEIPYSSYAYTKWLMERGFGVARQIIIARQIMDYGKTNWNSLNASQQDTLRTLKAEYENTVQAFTEASRARDEETAKALNRARYALQAAGENAANALNYMKDAKWSSSTFYYRDPVLMDYTGIDWR